MEREEEGRYMREGRGIESYMERDKEERKRDEVNNGKFERETSERAHRQQNTSETESESPQWKVRKWEAEWEVEEKASEPSQADSFPEVHLKMLFRLLFSACAVHSNTTMKDGETNNRFTKKLSFYFGCSPWCFPPAQAHGAHLALGIYEAVPAAPPYSTEVKMCVSMHNFHVTGLEGISFVDQ